MPSMQHPAPSTSSLCGEWLPLAANPHSLQCDKWVLFIRTPLPTKMLPCRSALRQAPHNCVARRKPGSVLLEATQSCLQRPHSSITKRGVLTRAPPSQHQATAAAASSITANPVQSSVTKRNLFTRAGMTAPSTSTVCKWKQGQRAAPGNPISSTTTSIQCDRVGLLHQGRHGSSE
jgi:hypothetical protein